MPNTPVRRVESCCMPPKKSAWRFENATKRPEHSPSKSQFVESDKINNYNMGIMSNASEMKPVDRIQLYPSVEKFSLSKREQIEDAPLDFSVKKSNNIENKHESMNYLRSRLENYGLNGGNSVVNNAQMQMFYPTKLINGHHSPSSPSNNSPPLDSSHASSSCKDSDSLDMDCSQESVKSPLHPVVPCVNRTNEINQVNSPERRSASRENSPVSQPSILEGMLKGQQQSNLGLPNGPTFGNVYSNGLSAFENQISSPPMPMGAPVIHPANMLPLNMAQYFGYGYVEHPNPFMQGYMYKPPEATMIDVSGSRKPKRKNDPFPDSLKSYSVEELRKKLDSLNGGSSSLLMNSDYAVLLKPSYNQQECNGRQFSNNASPEPVNNCAGSTSENGEIDNSVSSHNQINSSAEINPKKENGAAIDIKAEENNSQIRVNHNEMNGVNNGASTSRADDSNDSLANNIPDTSDGRRRKPMADYRDDPNYRMKRAKNNMAARRSRESRRIKEELIRKTASVLEQQNKVILRDLTALRYTFDEAQMKYFALLKEYENMKIQNSVLAERLNQKRCGQCGSALPNVSSPGL